jgi:DNA-binding IclR family transcriptional regulator
MRPADEEILRALRDQRPDYLALVANRLGMHLGYVERRCAVLVEEGLVEPVSAEAVYRTTELGQRYLAGEVDGTALTARGD